MESTTRHTVLVTGATGFIGRAVVRLLLHEDYRVRAFSRSRSGWPFPPHPHLERVTGDMQSGESLRHAANGAEWVVHLAAAKSDERDSRQTNVEGARNLVDALRGAHVPFVINISTQSAKLQRRGIYAETKAQADALLHRSGLAVTTLRVSLVYGDMPAGVFGSIVRLSKLPVIPIFGDGTTRFSPIHRDDLARVILLASRLPAVRGKTFDVGGPETLSFDQLVAAILARRGMRRPIVHLPVSVGLLLARALAILPRPPLSVSNVLGGAENVPLDLQTFFREFDHVPRPFSQGLVDIFPSFPAPPLDEEAHTLLRYVLAARWEPRSQDCERYRTALRSHGVDPSPHIDGLFLRTHLLLGMLDAVTRLRMPTCTLQKKILVAAAIAECHPASASILLPQARSPVAFIAAAARALTRAVAFFLGGSALLVLPRLLKRNAGR